MAGNFTTSDFVFPQAVLLSLSSTDKKTKPVTSAREERKPLFRYASVREGILSSSPDSGAPPGITANDKENSPSTGKRGYDSTGTERWCSGAFSIFLPTHLGKMIPGHSGGTSQ